MTAPGAMSHIKKSHNALKSLAYCANLKDSVQVNTG